jgi:Domain of unknown function (DUF397)
VNHEAAQATFRSCTQWRKSSYSISEECVEIITELPAGLVSGTARSVQTAQCWPLPPRSGGHFAQRPRRQAARLTDRRAEDSTRR